jgi:hypothetical protein
VDVDTISQVGTVLRFSAPEVVRDQGVNMVIKPVALDGKVGVDLGGSVCREEEIRMRNDCEGVLESSLHPHIDFLPSSYLM